MKAERPNTAKEGTLPKDMGAMTFMAIGQIKTGVSVLPEFVNAVIRGFHGRSKPFHPRPFDTVTFSIGGATYDYRWMSGPILGEGKETAGVHPASQMLTIDKYEQVGEGENAEKGKKVATLRIGSAFDEDKHGDVLDFTGGSASLQFGEAAEGAPAEPPIFGVDALQKVPQLFGDLLPE